MWVCWMDAAGWAARWCRQSTTCAPPVTCFPFIPSLIHCYLLLSNAGPALRGWRCRCRRWCKSMWTTEGGCGRSTLQANRHVALLLVPGIAQKVLLLLLCFKRTLPWLWFCAANRSCSANQLLCQLIRPTTACRCFGLSASPLQTCGAWQSSWQLTPRQARLAMALSICQAYFAWTYAADGCPACQLLTSRTPVPPSLADVPDSISFDSLKSLPTTLPWLRKQQAQAAAAGSAGGPAAAVHSDGGLPPVPGQVASLMQRPTFEAVAASLRKRLGLTLFGFDLVFDSIAGGVRAMSERQQLLSVLGACMPPAPGTAVSPVPCLAASSPTCLLWLGVQASWSSLTSTTFHRSRACRRRRRHCGQHCGSGMLQRAARSSCDCNCDYTILSSCQINGNC